MNITTESKKQTYALLDENSLKKEAIKLSKSTDTNIKKLGEEILKGLETSFENINQIIGSISAIMLLGLFVTPVIITVIISTLALMVATLPLAFVQTILNSQIKFLKSRLKPDENVKRYYTAVNVLLHNGNMSEITLESLLPVLEAPTKVTPDSDDNPVDYSEDLTSDENNEDEPVNYNDDMKDNTDTSEKEPEDTDTDNTEEDKTEETPDDGESIEDVEDEPINYEDDLDDISNDDESDNTSDDYSEPEIDEDNIQSENNRIKNYNLMLDFQKMHETIDDLIRHLKTVNYSKTIQNAVLSRCFDNITKIRDELIFYIEISFSRDYTKNLYYYNIFMQALKINVELMSRISNLDKENK